VVEPVPPEPLAFTGLPTVPVLETRSSQLALGTSSNSRVHRPQSRGYLICLIDLVP
jgi:hypothetical protein